MKKILIKEGIVNRDYVSFLKPKYVYLNYSEIKCADIIEISLKGINNITDMRDMFEGCDSLVMAELSEWNTSNIFNMSGIFKGCKSLINLPDISKWNTSNVNDMSYMFYECESLSSFPDLSKWDVSNVKNMEYMFCISEYSIIGFKSYYSFKNFT